ncbi:hypothetical protein [Kribbella sp. CA-293567]|uniref:hypothetical protein n=1 Tax=Kribbella sp. CA-293567 TaxID=3002436 RepID=UPI0022DE5D4F|nr:hypothetical protein [Kribbella sp. CA-293567]WBQ05878.1 hypothetical protein OX958_03530 [Kribbella sp. CA-293567]
MTFETELRDHLHAGVDDTPVDLGPLLAAGVAHGNKLVRRRRLTRILAGAATVAVLGGAFAYAGSVDGVPDGAIAPAGPGVTTQAQQAKADITPQATLALLLELMPDAKQAANRRGGFEGVGSVLGVYTTTDYGTASIRLEIVKDQHPLPCSDTDTDCKVTTLPDGSRLRLLDTTVPGPRGMDEYQQLQANLIRKDGLNLNLIAVNTAPAEPAVTMAQLRAIATSPRWQLQLDQAFITKSAGLFTPRLVTQPSVPQPIGPQPTSPGASK